MTTACSAMTRKVVCISPDDSLIDAYEIMTEWSVRHLPVVEGGRLVGILSDRDVILHSRGSESGLVVANVPVSEAATANPMTCSRGTDVASIADTMLGHKIDCLPVVDDEGVLVGLVTSSDLLEILADRERVTAKRPLPFQWRVYSGVRPGMIESYA